MRRPLMQEHPDPERPAEVRFQFRIPALLPPVPPVDAEDAETLPGIDVRWLAAARSA